MKILSCLFAFTLMFSGLALAQTTSVEESTLTFILSWKNSTARENGEAFSEEEIGGYSIIFSSAAGDKEFILTGARSGFVAEGLPPGDYSVRIATFDTEGTYSDYSNALNVPRKSRPLYPVEVSGEQRLPSIFDQLRDRCQSVNVQCIDITF